MDGKTRAQRNEIAEIAVPDYEIPDGSEYIWDWFTDLLTWYETITDGVARRLPPSELIAWATVTGNVVSVEEYAILRDMNAAWCDAMNDELATARAVQAERAKSKPQG